MAMRTRWPAAMLTILAPLLVLNALLSFDNDWPGLWVRFGARASVELAALVLGLSLWLGRRRTVPPAALTVLAIVVTLWSVLRYIDVTVPAIFGRPVNVYWDGRHLWQLLRMASDDAPWWWLAGGAAALALVLTPPFLFVRWLLRALAAALARPAERALSLVASAGLCAAFAAAPLLGVDRHAFFPRPLTATIAEQAVRLHAALSPTRSESRLSPSPLFNGELSALAGADVLIIFAEAYGAASFDIPEIADALAPGREALATSLRAGGRHAVSARVRSPTFGGASWLAHGALLSGVDTRDPDDYDLLLTTTRPTLVSHFARHGYRTIAWMPGLQRPWPEGRFYGFDRYGDADSIGYLGRGFGYWRIPDQAAIALLQAQELAPAQPPEEAARSPRFIVFPTVTTHAPFRPVPPYLQDWSKLLRPDAYSAAAVEQALAQPKSWVEPLPAYLDAMRYQFDWLAAYVGGHAPPDALNIVIGDHQPIGGVSGRDASWDVPVHVLSRDEALLARFEALGFTAGLTPPAGSIGGMHELTPILLTAFGRSPLPDPAHKPRLAPEPG